MFWKSKNSKFNSLIARLYQTTGDCFAYFYFHILTFSFLAYFLISDNKILLYQRNIKEISKKYQRNIKEISKKYQRNKFLFIEANYFYILRGLKFPESRFAAVGFGQKFKISAVAMLKNQ
jgi:hypothetical protein